MTDRERDVQIAESLIGKPNDYFKNIWSEFGTGWDGAPCSEIACCISYMAGNLNTIPVSNYAEGLYNAFVKRGAVGDVPQVGAFVFFGYGNVPDHTGRVVEVTNKKIITIEGNINNKVVRRSYNFNNMYIFAYGYPDYANDPRADFIRNAPRDFTLKKGDYSFTVMWLQWFLFKKGFYEGTFDGDFGSFTEKALKEYQKANNLAVDGVCGWHTLTNILK